MRCGDDAMPLHRPASCCALKGVERFKNANTCLPWSSGPGSWSRVGETGTTAGLSASWPCASAGLQTAGSQRGSAARTVFLSILRCCLCGVFVVIRTLVSAIRHSPTAQNGHCSGPNRRQANAGNPDCFSQHLLHGVWINRPSAPCQFSSLLITALCQFHNACSIA